MTGPDPRYLRPAPEEEPTLLPPAGDTAPPRVLLVATLPWLFPVRFAISLRDAGFEVETACPADHAFTKLRLRPKRHRLRLWREIPDVARAIQVSMPDLIVPCDDRAVSLLHKLHRDSQDAALKARIAASLGRPDSYDIVASKSRLLAFAKLLALPVPNSEPVRDAAALAATLAPLSYPIVLKRDGTWSGKGVRIVQSAAGVPRAWRQLTRRPGLFLATKLAVFDGDRVFLERMKNAPRAIDCQQFINGRPANRVSLFMAGEEIAGFNLMTLETSFGATGPSSVVRLIEQPDMVQTARELGRALGLCGFCGFDFMLSDADGRAYLLEANPRLTPSAGLAFAGAAFLPQQLFNRLTGRNGPPPRNTASGDTVAYFPDECGRDGKSPYLEHAHHDVPWDEPGLMKIGRKQIARRRLALRLRLSVARCKAYLRPQRRKLPDGLPSQRVPSPEEPS